MKAYKFQILVAAIMATLAFPACQKEAFVEEDTPADAHEGCYSLTLEASKENPGGAGNNEATKALSLTTGTPDRLNAYWRTGEQVAVYLGGTLLGMLDATPNGTDPTRATLSGSLTTVAGVTQGAQLTLLFPRADWDYTGQDGTAPGETDQLATQYDYASATVTVASVDTGNQTITTTSGAAFQNQQSVYRFGFQFNGEPLSVKTFSVSSDHNKLVTSRSYSGGWTSTYGSLSVSQATATTELLYLSIRNENDNTAEADKFSFYVISGNNALYLGEKDIPGDKLGNGKFVSAQSISMTKSDLARSGTATEVW